MPPGLRFDRTGDRVAVAVNIQKVRYGQRQYDQESEQAQHNLGPNRESARTWLGRISFCHKDSHPPGVCPTAISAGRSAYRCKSHGERQAIPLYCRTGNGAEGYNSQGMIQLRITGENRPGPSLRSQPDLTTKSYGPKFAIPWTNRREVFVSSVLALLRGPAPVKKFSGALYFRDCWIEQRSPRGAFVVAIACQALLILFPPPVWNIRPAQVEAFSPQMELTWYGPAKDFPAILPAPRLPMAPPRNDASETSPRRGADTFHPRQTIISKPLHPTHPRQTLIQPAAPPEPPKILPQLPNIVQLAGSEPARPKLRLTPEQLAAMRPKAPASSVMQNTATPEVSALEKQAGEINIASSAQAPPKPVLPVSPMSAPRAAQQRGDTNAATPEIAQQLTGDSNTLIALSATPAPVAPAPSVPPGNLSARISISPEGLQPRASGGATEGKSMNGGSAAGGGGHAPDGIFVSGGNSANTAPTSGPGLGSAS